MNVVAHISTMKQLEEFIKSKHIKVVYKKSSEMWGYVGLHYEIDKQLGLKIQKNTIWLDENLYGRERFRTLKHEVEEMLLMRERGMKYFPAHKIATRDETKR